MHHQWQKLELSQLELRENEIHVWRASLRQPQVVVQELCSILLADEVSKAERFYFEKDRHHYIVTHGVLRVLLGRYLNTEPDQLSFRRKEA
jgi:4'-phosphopantetheinyl transferase